jgi:predicted acylesterase/phospholipase RssA
MPMRRHDLYACVGGGGPSITYLAGGAAGLHASARVHGWAGVSAGAIIAAAKAFSVSDQAIRESLERVLSTGSALKIDPAGLARGGLFSLEGLRSEIDAMIGKGARLGDSLVPLVVVVTDLDTGTPWYLTSRQAPKVSVVEAVLASSSFMSGITPARAIPSLGTVMSPDVRLWGDGGLCDNTADHVWDSKPQRRALIRCEPDHEVTRVRAGDLVGLAAAQVRAMLYAQGGIKSRRDDGIMIDVPRGPWDFIKTPDRVVREWGAGYDAARAQVMGWVP